MTEPVLALAATPRDWAQRLHRHVADHGGARVRATVLTAAEATAEHYDVLIADDRTSFLSQRLVRRLHDSGRAVIGLYDPQDPQGKSDLIEWEVDEARPADTSAQELVSLAAALLGRTAGAVARQSMPAPPPVPAPPAREPGAPSRLVVVTGTRGGGRTEVALGLAAALSGDSGRAVVAELDEVNASLAPRLGLAAYPNLRAAVDWSRQSAGGALGAVQRAEAGLGVLVAGPLPRVLGPLSPDDLSMVVDDLCASGDWIVVDAGDARGWTPPGHAQVVVTGAATPVGALRLGPLLTGQSAPVHAVVNRAPASVYRRWEFLDELRHAHMPRSLTTVPEDRTVFDAAWRGRAGTRGAFGKAMRRLAGEVRHVAEAAR